MMGASLINPVLLSLLSSLGGINPGASGGGRSPQAWRATLRRRPEYGASPHAVRHTAQRSSSKHRDRAAIEPNICHMVNALPQVVPRLDLESKLPKLTYLKGA